MMVANSRRRIGNKRFVWMIAMIASEAVLFAEKDGACMKD
jgi:hypothetical protein